MRKIFKILAAFLAFIFFLFGVVSILRGLEVVSRSVDPNLPGISPWNLYELDFRSHPYVVDFYIGCGLISASLTFFWIQRRKSD
jgi:hypothetical protein